MLAALAALSVAAPAGEAGKRNHSFTTAVALVCPMGRDCALCSICLCAECLLCMSVCVYSMLMLLLQDPPALTTHRNCDSSMSSRTSASSSSTSSSNSGRACIAKWISHLKQLEDLASASEAMVDSADADRLSPAGLEVLMNECTPTPASPQIWEQLVLQLKVGHLNTVLPVSATSGKPH